MWNEPALSILWLDLIATPWCQIRPSSSSHLPPSVLTRQGADVAAGVSQAVTADDLLKSLPHLLTPEGIDERVDHRVAHDEDQVHVEVGHEAHAVEVPRTGDHQDEVQEEGSPADDEDPQQDGERDGPLHAGPLVDGVVTGEGGDALDVRAGQHEHVAVEGSHDEEHGEEHGDQADDDGGGVRVDDEDDAAACAESPDSPDDAACSLHCHDVVVPQRIEDGDVPVNRSEIIFYKTLRNRRNQCDL